MISRRPLPSPETDLASNAELVQRVREAATPVDHPDAWIKAEDGQERIRTGGKGVPTSAARRGGRRTASAGQYAAHTLRLAALADESDVAAWTTELTSAATTAALNSWDWDERMQAALNLRRTYKDLTKDQRSATSVVRVQLVATWLTHTSGPDLVAATARLAEYVLDEIDDGRLEEHLTPAWYATHGRRLLAELIPVEMTQTPRKVGRPVQDDEHLEQIKRAVRGVDAAHIMTRKDLARSAGMSRQTLMNYLATA